MESQNQDSRVTGEIWKLSCYGCNRELELPAGATAESLHCPNCGAPLMIDWRPV